ncbi:MAG: type II secretion system protein [Verrucomicrobia bacterium]|nr:type II secretion system protein [Verrucomicrobiota bacterium]
MKRKKRPLTLLEIMIVIMLIGLIGSVIGVNMKGSLDEGRAFKTERAIEQIKDVLMLEVARGTPAHEVIEKKEAYLANSGLVKNPKKFLNDGWDEPFQVYLSETSPDKILVKSERLKAYKAKKNAKLGKTGDLDEDDDFED